MCSSDLEIAFAPSRSMGRMLFLPCASCIGAKWLFCERHASSPSRDPHDPRLEHACIGRGAGNCLVEIKSYGSSQSPVRRFMSATPVPLRPCPRKLRFPWGPCVPHRHVRGSTPHSRGRRRPRRETIFCNPLMRKLTSFFRTRRWFRLAATPCGVSATGQGDDGMGARCGENRARCYIRSATRTTKRRWTSACSACS